MISTLEQVKIFMEKFKRPVKDKPDLSDERMNALCINLIEEEFEELVGAIKVGDVLEALDALTDLQYVLDFTYLALGFHKIKDEAFAEVQASNMSKLGLDGQPILRPEDDKIMKGPDYFKPDLQQFINKLAA